ncbi:MAG: Na+/H+ antiporter NhaA, partial [Cycloclasticus sp.]|nr:Na+/H+ antiporter NhaA [Cycloclasticus sp.]
QDLSILHLLSAFALIAFLALGNYAGVRQPYFYIIVGIATWWMMLKSGVHPTFAGVAIALTVPARPKLTSEKLLDKAKTTINSMQEQSKPVDVLGSRTDHEQVIEVRDFAERASTPLRRWEDALSLPVALFILPLFVLTNAGVPFNLASFIESLQYPTGLGIISGLVLGKFIGISGACWLGLRYKIGCLPDRVNFQHVVGISLIAGIGFTMSTFIATLGFDSQPVHLQSAKSSILMASLVSAIFGVLYIRFVAAKKQSTTSANDEK